MAEKIKIEISQEAYSVAAQQASENGFATADEYIDAVLRDDLDDLDAIVAQPWFAQKIEEGLASPDAGELTRERIDQLVQEGIALAKLGG
jgi:hypothetical protein